jgi:hypothetical protein
MWRRRMYVRVTGSIVRTLRRLTGQRFLPSSPGTGEGGSSDWRNLTAEDLRRQGIMPGMPPPTGGPAPRAVTVPRRRHKPGSR